MTNKARSLAVVPPATENDTEPTDLPILDLVENIEVAFTRNTEREPTKFDDAVGRLPLDGSKGFTFNLPRTSDDEADKKLLTSVRRQLTSAGDLHDRTVRWQVTSTVDKDSRTVYRIDVKASKKVKRTRKTTTDTAPDAS